MFSVHKSIDIDFAHHVSGHDGACINIHGHTWKFEVEVQAKQLNDLGFVIDFKKLKTRVLEPVHTLLDHSLALGVDRFDEIYSQLEVVGTNLLATNADLVPPQDVIQSIFGATQRHPGGMKLAVFPFNPTSELLARWLFDGASKELNDHRMRVTRASVYETLHPVESVAHYTA